MSANRARVTRPIAIALAFTLAGEALILVIWGLALFPAGALWPKAVWTGTCGVAMGLVIGALVHLAVTGRVAGLRAAGWCGGIYLGVLAFCTLLCFRIDLATGGQFGAIEAPGLFLGSGLLAAAATAPLYAWLVTSAAGARLLDRFGW